jgi:hypothetical protein
MHVFYYSGFYSIYSIYGIYGSLYGSIYSGNINSIYEPEEYLWHLCVGGEEADEGCARERPQRQGGEPSHGVGPVPGFNTHYSIEGVGFIVTSVEGWGV